jgi:hypothetical protein
VLPTRRPIFVRAMAHRRSRTREASHSSLWRSWIPIRRSESCVILGPLPEAMIRFAVRTPRLFNSAHWRSVRTRTRWGTRSDASGRWRRFVSDMVSFSVHKHKRRGNARPARVHQKGAMLKGQTRPHRVSFGSSTRRSPVSLPDAERGVVHRLIAIYHSQRMPQGATQDFQKFLLLPAFAARMGTILRLPPAVIERTWSSHNAIAARTSRS